MDHVEIKMPKISIQESVEAVENVLQERIPERMCEQTGVIEVLQSGETCRKRARSNPSPSCQICLPTPSSTTPS